MFSSNAYLYRLQLFVQLWEMELAVFAADVCQLGLEVAVILHSVADHHHQGREVVGVQGQGSLHSVGVPRKTTLQFLHVGPIGVENSSGSTLIESVSGQNLLKKAIL